MYVPGALHRPSSEASLGGWVGQQRALLVVILSLCLFGCDVELVLTLDLDFHVEFQWSLL